MTSDVYKRMQQLSSYIKQVEQNVDKDDMRKAAAIVQANKKKVDNNTILKFAFQTQFIEALTNNNDKLRRQLEDLRAKKAQLKKQNQNSEVPYNSGLVNQRVGISNVRFKITLSDTQKIQFEIATLQINFEIILIYNHQQETQKSLNFGDFLLVEKKNTHVLVEYETLGQRRYLMIECSSYDQALRIFRSLSFGKLIKQNQHRTSLFIEETEAEKDQDMVNLSDSIGKSKEKSKDKELSKQLLSSSHVNSNHNLLHLGYNNNLNHSGYQHSAHEKSFQNINSKISPFFLINRARGSSVFHSQFGHPGGYNNQGSNNLRKLSVDERTRKMSFQNILGRQKNGGVSHNSFDNSNSHNSQSNPPSPVPVQHIQPIQFKPDAANFNLSKRIIQKQKQKQQLLDHFIQKQQKSKHQNLFETTNNYKIEQKDDQYKSKSSQNNRGFRHSLDSKLSNQDYYNGQNQQQLHKRKYQPIAKNILVQSDYISQKSEQLEVSSPGFPKKIHYNSKQQQIKKKQTLQLGLVKIDSQQLHSSEKINESGSASSQRDYEHDQGSQSDNQEQNGEYNQQGNGSQSSEQSENSSTESIRKNILQSGLIMTKCSVDGFYSHEKHVKLSQNQMELIYQDTKDRKKKTISLNDIDKIEYMCSGPGINKHIKHVDLEYCLLVHVKQGKFSKGKSKTLQFYGTEKQILERFSRYLAQFVEAIQKN